MTKTYDAMLAGRPYSGADPYLFELKAACQEAKARFDAIPVMDIPARIAGVPDLFDPESGPSYIMSPFNIQYGRHVKWGTWSFANFGCTFLDSARITIGDWVAIACNVQFITDTHPTNPEERFLPPEPDSPIPYTLVNLAYPITVEDRVWIGAGAIIMPGVKIGEGAMVAAGSVVTRDVPARMVVAGNPARVLRPVDEGPPPDYDPADPFGDATP